jgi:hypothetical protein
VSQDEQVAVMGRTVAEYAEGKRKLAALMAKAARIGKAMQVCGAYLATQESAAGPGGALQRGSALPPDLGEIPSMDELRGLVAEALEARKRMSELRKQLSDFGVDTRDSW